MIKYMPIGKKPKQTIVSTSYDDNILFHRKQEGNSSGLAPLL